MARWLTLELPDGFPDPVRDPADFDAATMAIGQVVGAVSGLTMLDPLRFSFRRAPDAIAEALDAEGVSPS
jgi:hypothetical protein